MKKVVMFFFALIMAISLKAQDLDVFQVNVSWDYVGNMYKPNQLGSSWHLSPEIKYYFLGRSKNSFYPPNRTTLGYANELLIGAYLLPTWGSEWSRDSVAQNPRIVNGINENAGVQNFEFGLSFKYIVNSTLSMTLDAGMGIKSLEIKNGVNDLAPKFPYYQGVPINFTLLYLDDYYQRFNKIKLSLGFYNSFLTYRALQNNSKFYIDTIPLKKEKSLKGNLEWTIFSPKVGQNIIDFSVINHFAWYQGERYLNPKNTQFEYALGIGVDVRGKQSFNEAMRINILLGRYGLSAEIKMELSALYGLIYY